MLLQRTWVASKHPYSSSQAPAIPFPWDLKPSSDLQELLQEHLVVMYTLRYISTYIKNKITKLYKNVSWISTKLQKEKCWGALERIWKNWTEDYTNKSQFSVAKDTWCQAQWPDYDACSSNAGKTEITPTSSPLTYILTKWYLHKWVCKCACTHA